MAISLHRIARVATVPLPILALAVLVGAAGTAVRGEVRPAACFGSHMVLQREMPVPVWGTAAPREKVTVALGDVSAEATADAKGHWKAVLEPQEASAEPRPLVIRGAKDEIRLDDVLVGEVWLCAGQSNMLLPLSAVGGGPQAAAAAKGTGIRLLRLETAAGGDPPAYTAAQIADLEPSRFCTGKWEVATPETAGKFSAVGWFMGATLAKELGVPVGLVCAAVGGSPTEAWVSRTGMAADRTTAAIVKGDWMRNPALAGWCVERAGRNLARARKAGEAIPGDALGPNHPFKPAFLWDACVAPLVPMAIRGVAWYQGESNADSTARVAQHATLFPVLVADWRRQWKRDDLPVAFVQLPGMNRPDWPAFRETQRRALGRMKHAGMAVTIDLGSKTDVHPRDKQPVGERLAAWALAEVHGRPGAVPSGPLPAAAEFRADGTVIVRFDHAAGLATKDGEAPRHFEVAGRDGAFAPAEARIDGETVAVTPPSGLTPRRIRYAWRPFPEPPVNIVNEAKLPASPFEVEVGGRE